MHYGHHCTSRIFLPKFIFPIKLIWIVVKQGLNFYSIFIIIHHKLQFWCRNFQNIPNWYPKLHNHLNGFILSSKVCNLVPKVFKSRISPLNLWFSFACFLNNFCHSRAPYLLKNNFKLAQNRLFHSNFIQIEISPIINRYLT